ncbi:MAG: YihY/virulence factor BrkB family protein [Thermosulfidibacteraceae bacterium]|jgi:membrane protein
MDLDFEALKRMFYFIWSKMKESEVFLRAGALTYMSLFSIVPFLAFSTSILKGLGGYKILKTHVYEMANYFFYGNTTIIGILEKVFYYVERTNFATLGFVGAFALLWAVVNVFSNIENSLAKIWLVEERRSLPRKILDYTAISVLFPISINTFVLSVAFIKNTFLSVLLNIIPFFLLVLIIFLFYHFIPLVDIDFKPNLLGAFCAALLWVFIQYIYYKLQVGLSGYNAIYGSFAALPLFMLAVYWSWFSFLLGAVISFTYANRYIFLNADTSFMVDYTSPVEKFLLSMKVMNLVYENFKKGMGVERREIAERLKIPPILLGPIIEELTKANILVLSEKGVIYPGLPEESCNPEKILEVFVGPLVRDSVRIKLEVVDGS